MIDRKYDEHFISYKLNVSLRDVKFIANKIKLTKHI